MPEEEMRAGWAIRRWRPDSQECPDGEFGDKTWGDWFGCCPEETSANQTGGNTQCDRGNIMGDSTPKDQCANSTWTLWYHKGYFCCDSEGDDRGYFYPDDSVGCANNSWINDAPSDVSRAGSRPNPPPASSATASSTSTPTPTSTTSSTPIPTSTSTNKGAIAGGIVGGVCGALLIVGIIWLLCRRRRPKTLKTDEAAPVTSNSPLQQDTRHMGFPNELEDTNRELSEIDGSRELKELPPALQPRSELP